MVPGHLSPGKSLHPREGLQARQDVIPQPPPRWLDRASGGLRDPSWSLQERVALATLTGDHAAVLCVCLMWQSLEVLFYGNTQGVLVPRSQSFPFHIKTLAMLLTLEGRACDVPASPPISTACVGLL